MDDRVWHKFYDEGVPKEVDFEDTTLPQFLERAVERYGDRPALIFFNARLSYRQLKDQVDRLATALAEMGVGRDSRVALQMPNLPQMVIGYYAILSLGAKAVPTNPLYTPREIEHQWRDAGCSVAIVSDFIYEGRIKQIRDQLPIDHYIIASIPEYMRFPLNFLAPLKLKKQQPPLVAKVAPGPGIRFFRKLVAATEPRPPSAEIGMDDIATLLYTGGTTGLSKGAVLTHRNLSYNVQQLMSWTTKLEPGREVVLTALPLFHSYGLTVSMNFGIAMGAALVLLPNPRDIPTMIKTLAKHRVTMAPAVPAMYTAIVQFPDIKKYDLSSIKTCNSGSAPLPVEILRRFEEMTGGKITEGFGLTETSPVTHSNPIYGTRKVGSIGVPFPSTDAKIVDAEDGVTELSTGEVGELIITGPQVMQGYLNKPEETANVIRNGWLYTGDLARVDEDGFCFIEGRKKDMIICSGYNVYPDEIDRVLMDHPALLEAGTIGIPHEKRGETVKSFVVLRPGKTVTADELTDYCREYLAPYKIPRSIEFRDALPKSSVLKILRRQLREEELAKAGR